MAEQLLNTLDQVHRAVNGRTQRAERSEIGQFLTPAAIARFMASLFAPNRLDHVRILDAGAGAGVPFSAYVEALVSEGRRPLSIVVEAGYYVLTKRFSSKEERRRVTAAVYDPQRIASHPGGFENHLNYYPAGAFGSRWPLLRNESLPLAGRPPTH